MRAILLMAIFAVGCGAVARVSETAPQGRTFATSWTPDRCQRLLDQRDAVIWAAALGGGLSGVGGIATAIPEDDRRDARLGVGISTAVVAAVATSMTVLAKLKTSEFEQYCNVALDPMTPISSEPGDAPIDVEVIRADDVVDVEWTPVDGGVEGP
jgi:hypothetical protein